MFGYWLTKTLSFALVEPSRFATAIALFTIPAFVYRDVKRRGLKPFAQFGIMVGAFVVLLSALTFVR